MDRRHVARLIALLLFALVWLAVLFIIWKANEKRVPETAPAATAAAHVSTPAEQTTAPEAVGTSPSPPTPAPEETASEDASEFGGLRGRVFDAVSGKPVPEFVVEFQVEQPTQNGDIPGFESAGTSDVPVSAQGGRSFTVEVSSRTFRSKDGRFEWEQLSPHNWMLTVEARGYQPFVLHKIEVMKGEARREIPVPLRRGLALRGRVYDEATGAGIADATLFFRDGGIGLFEGGAHTRDRHRTTMDGSFVVDGLPPGRVTLSIHAPGYAGENREVHVDGAAPLEIAMSSGGRITGRLMAADGVTPVIGGVHLANLDLGHGTGIGTGRNGEFSFSGLEPGRYAITGEAQGGSSMPIEIVLTRNERVEGLILSLTTGRTIRGKVSGLSAEKRRELRIQLVYENISTGHWEKPVDDQGSYAFNGVRPGPVYVMAMLPRRSPLERKVTVTPDADVTVDFDFSQGVRLYGRVTRGGRPVPNVGVGAQHVTDNESYGGAGTSNTGEYVIEGLAKGEYRVRAATQRALVYVTGDTELDFDLPDRHLSGHVFEAGGKVPLAGVHVSVRYSTVLGSSLAQAGTDHSGAFEILDLEPGDITLSAYKSGYEMLRQTLSFKDSVSDLTLTLRPDPGVQIRARDAASGTALGRVQVMETVKGGQPHLFFLDLDTEGVGRLPAALAGSRLVFVAMGYAWKEVPAWDGLPLDLQFARAE